jgi:predicted PurR-regulated permease PerM
MDLGRSPAPTRALVLFARLGSLALVVVILALGRPVLMPIALAAILAFILTPPMKWLQRRISRLPALALVMLLAMGTLGTAGYVVATELGDLTTRLGKYTESMRRKVTALREGGGGPLARAEVMVARVADGLERRPGPDDTTVRVAPAELSTAAHLWNLFRPLAEPLFTSMVVLVLCVFMLGQRDDLRSRLIRLVGTSNVTSTTRTLDDGAQRITRYLVAQSVINATFGALVGAGLYGLGIPYAALWGAVSAVARFVPYLGALASMLLPAALAFAIFPGWERALLTVALFLGVDVVAAYVIEPLLIGRRTGISSLALLVSALFWTWLWGPMGLLLSTPITVALVVLGRHVPDLQFLAVLLGDEQVVGAEITYYQRLLARDEDEASELAQSQLSALGFAGVMDQIIIPTLALATADLARKKITAEDETFIVTWSRDILLHLAQDGAEPEPAQPCRALGIAAHQAESELLLQMLSVELAPRHGRLELLPSTATLAEILARVERGTPELVCLAGLPPEGGPFLRQLCHRLKARFPALLIVAFRPGEPGVDAAAAARRLREAGADLVVSTLAEASTELSQLLGRGTSRPAVA